MADNYDELGSDELDIADQQDERDAAASKPSALPIRNKSKRNLHATRGDASEVDGNALASFDFDSLIKKPEPAAPAPAKKGMLDSLVDTAKDAGKAVKNFVAPDANYLPGSVMNDLPPQEPLPSASRAPVAPGVRRALEGQYDAADPDTRTQLASRPGAAGDVFRQREAEYARRTTPSKVLDTIDPSAESRANRYIDQGMDSKIAVEQGSLDASQGVIGQTVGQATVSKFDFETAEKYAKDPFFKNPGVRAAVKGIEGYKQRVIGINQFLSDVVGANEAADHYAAMYGDSEAFKKAVGDPANYGQRMFENVVSSIVQQIPDLLGGAVTGSQALVLSAMGVGAFGQNYSEGRAAGQTIDQAATRAAQMAAFEVIGEKIGLGDKLGSLRALVKGNQFEEAVKLMAKSSIKEVPGEQITTLGQFAVDKEGAGYGIRREAELKDLVEQMRDTLVQTMMQGALMTGGVQGTKMIADRLPQRNPMPADGSVPQTTQEPQSDILAQINAVADPANPKDAVFVAKGTAVPQDLPADIQVVERPEGTLLTNNPQKAQVYGETQHLTDDMMAQILGLPQSKTEVLNSGTEAGVVQARDVQGNVVNEAVTDGSGANEQAIGTTVPEGGTLTTTTPEQAQQERAAKVAQESIVPGQQDSSIDDLLGGVKEVDENGNPIQQEVPPAAPEAPVAPPQQQPEQAPVPPVETAPAPPAEAKTKPVRKPKVPKVETAPQTPKESFAQKMGAKYSGEAQPLQGNESKKLEAAAKKSEPEQVFKELAKSSSPTVKFVGEAAQKSSERYGQPLKLRVSDKEVNERVTRSVNRVIEDSQLAINTLDAMRSVQSLMANYVGKGLPAEVKGKMILPPGSHSGLKSGLTLGKVLRDNGIANKAGFDLYLKNEEKRLAPKESALRDNAKMRKVQADSVGGLHDPRDHTILVRRARAMREHVIAHEVTHALTSEAIDRPTDAQRPYVEALGRLYDHVKSVGNLQNQYGMQDMKEFIAEGFSNPDFQHELAQIKYEGSTAWEKFTQMIARLLGMKHDNAFVEMMRIGEALMDSTQTKSAIGNNAESNGSNGNISMWSKRQQAMAGNRFNISKESKLDYLQNGLQDRFNRIKKIQTEVKAQGGTVTSDSDVYAADERYHGAAAAKIGWFTKYKVKPLMQQMGKEGIDPDDVGLYLYALHAKERNAQIARINQTMPDGGSGMTNAEAAQILRSFQQDPNFARLQAFAAKLQAITAETRKVMLDGHLVDQNTVNEWDAAYKNYVPLKGFEKIDENGKAAGSGRGYDVRGPESRRALGRESRAGNIIENIIMDHERALNRAERNKVARALLRFVLQNKDDNLWEVNKVVTKGQLRKDPSPGNVLYRLETMKDKDRTITVKENGKEFYVLIKDQKMFQQLQGEKGALNMEGLSADFFRVWGGFNRFLTKMWTALNPAFTLVNAIRDTTTAIVHGSTAVSPMFAAKVATMAPTAIRAIYRSERSQTDKLTIGPAGPQTWDEWYQQYQEDGGKAGFYMFSQLEDKERELRAVFKHASDLSRGTTKRKAFVNAQKYLSELHDIIMDANGAIENMNRVAAYRVAIQDYNMSREEAAALAKNLTVNFNRRGTLAPLIGSFYLFFNPAVQGTSRMIKAFRDNKAMMSGFLGGMVGIGYLVAMMAEGDEDENGMPYWDKIPAYEKEKNVIISAGGGRRIALPMAYGYGFFVHLGYLLRDLQRGRPGASVSLEMLDSWISHFVPIAYQRENPATAMVPSVAIPALEAMTNIKATGQPLMPDARKLDGSEKPDSERYWNASRGTMAQKAAEFLNEITYGDKFEGGAIDISPETISNSVRGYLGGGGTFAYDTINSIVMATKGESFGDLLDKGAVPFAKGFYKGDNGKGDQAYFMKYSKDAVAALDRFKEMQNSDDPAVIKRLEKTRDLAELGAAVHNVQKAAGVLRKQQVAVQEDKTATEPEKKEALKEIEKARTSLYSQFNAAMFKLQYGKKD